MAELQQFVDAQIEQISPLKKVSFELSERAKSVTITDAKTLKEAVSIRKDITKHQKAVKDLRLDITRQFDDVKSQFIAAEKDVLEPAEEAKELVGQKILSYEEEQERIRQAEIQRIESITAEFATNVRALRTLKAIDNRGAEIKIVYSSLTKEDRENGVVKLAFTQVINSLLERRDEIRTAQIDEAEQAKAVAERRGDLAIAQLQAIEAEQLKANGHQDAPRTGIKTVTRFAIVNPTFVPREFCVPSDQLIREAINKGLTEIPGVKITQEKSF